MNNDLNHSATSLARGKLQRIQDGKGLQVLCLTGDLWLTQHADPRDIVLEAGDEFTIELNGASYLSALTDSSFVLLRDATLVDPGPIVATARRPLTPSWAARWVWS